MEYLKGIPDVEEKERQMEAKTVPSPQYVEAKIVLPKQVLDFLKAIHSFGKYEESFEEFLGYQVTFSVQADIGNNLEEILDMAHITKAYGLENLDC